MGMIQQAQKSSMEKSKKPTMQDYVKMYESQIAKALPNVLTPERFARMVTTALTKTPKLAECTPASFVGAMLTAAQLGLEPNTPLGQAYLIPYGDRCEFQIGYKGLLELANRSGELKMLEARIVYKNDDFDIQYGLNPILIHKPNFQDRGEMIGVYAIYKLMNGAYSFDFMTTQEITERKDRFSKGGSAWQTDFESMAKKTVIKRLLKYAPLKTEFVNAVANDEKTQKIEFTEDSELIIVNEDISVVEENNNNGEVIVSE